MSLSRPRPPSNTLAQLTNRLSGGTRVISQCSTSNITLPILVWNALPLMTIHSGSRPIAARPSAIFTGTPGTSSASPAASQRAGRSCPSPMPAERIRTPRFSIACGTLLTCPCMQRAGGQAHMRARLKRLHCGARICLHTGVRAAVTQAVGAMELVDVPEPPQPGPGQVVVGGMAVGIGGSDYHFFSGHLTEEAGGGRFPRIQGHEVAGTVAAVGEGCDPALEPGRPVALHPLSACGTCYPCRAGRPNTCDNFQLIGIHVDGGLQELLLMPADQVIPIDEEDPAIGAMAEPIS